MKIILEPTEPQQPPSYYSRVEVSVPSDEIDFDETLSLIQCALLAWGFSPETVTSFFDEEKR